MYDPLIARYCFSCPSQGSDKVAISSFRNIGQLPGAKSPAVFHVLFSCTCGEDHIGLVSHDDLDWAPVSASPGPFLNLMTSKMEYRDDDILFSAAAKIKSGNWPWSFFCYAENKMQPAVPSSFIALSPSEHRYGLLARCFSCKILSINLVTQQHLDLPFYNDKKVAVVPHIFSGDATDLADRFSDDLWSGRFDSDWQDLGEQPA